MLIDACQKWQVLEWVVRHVTYYYYYTTSAISLKAYRSLSLYVIINSTRQYNIQQGMCVMLCVCERTISVLNQSTRSELKSIIENGEEKKEKRRGRSSVQWQDKRIMLRRLLHHHHQQLPSLFLYTFLLRLVVVLLPRSSSSLLFSIMPGEGNRIY